MSDTTCTRCGQTGHRASHCPWPAEASKKPDRLVSARPHGVRLGIAGYIAVLAAMRHDPCSYDDLQQATGIGRTAVRAVVAALRSVRLVRIAGWREVYRQAAAPLFAFGAGADAAPPAVRSNGRPSVGVIPPCAPKPTTTAAALATLVRCIEAEPRTLGELCIETGMAHQTVSLAVRALRRRRLAYVADHDAPAERGGRSTRRYGWGSRSDVPAPRILGRQQVNRRYREGLKARQSMLQVLHALAAPANDSAELEAA